MKTHVVVHSSDKRSHHCQDACRPKKQASGHQQDMQLTDGSLDGDDSQLSILSLSHAGAGRSSYRTVSGQS